MLAEPLYLAKYIERMGTGTGDMIRRCKAARLPEIEFRMTDGFTLIIPRPFTAIKKAPIEMSGKIIGLMQEEPEITIPEIAKRLKRTPR